MNIEVGTKLYGVKTCRYYEVEEILRRGTHAVIEDELGTILLKSIYEIEKEYINVSELGKVRKQKLVGSLFSNLYSPPSYFGQAIVIGGHKNHEVGNPVKWHEALLMAASGTPMHCGDDTGEYVKLDGCTLAWFNKNTDVKNCVLEVWEHSHWANNWVPYTPKKMVVDWTKVPVDTDVWVSDTGEEASALKKFKCYVDGNVYVKSTINKDILIKYERVELAEPNEDYMKEAE